MDEFDRTEAGEQYLRKGIKQLRAKVKRLQELLHKHRICTTCGKQLTEAEAVSVHTCYEKAAK